MAATDISELSLARTEGFVVESTEGDLGFVEEVWVDEANEPRALAVRTKDGRHGLLVAEDVLAVDREYDWVVVPPNAKLLELGLPRIDRRETEPGLMSASWQTTGDVLNVMPSRRAPHLPFTRRWTGSASVEREPKVWRAVALLLSSISALVVLFIVLAFVVARLVTGDAY